MARRPAETVPLHRALLEDLDQMLAIYDRSVQELIGVSRQEGYFDDWTPELLTWPGSSESGFSDLEALEHRVRLVDAIFQGVPKVRDKRLREAHDPFAAMMGPYHEGNRIYLQVKDQFIQRKAGTAQEFLQLYQTLYLEALAKGELFSPDAGEASLEEVKLTHVPLSHAQAVAEALSTVALSDDPRWEEQYEYDLDGKSVSGTLRVLLQEVAQRTLDLIAAGGLLSTRFNYLTNFAWFGSSVWKVIVDADLALYRLREAGQIEQADLQQDLDLLRSMLVEFFQAHQEDPTKLRPQNYWYGQAYSYLTRDMIDLTAGIVDRVNRLWGESEKKQVLPPLLAGTVQGRFLDYPHVGKREDISSTRRKLRFVRWARACWKVGRKRYRVYQSDLAPEQRWERAWQMWRVWSEKTMQIFGIQMQVRIDPMFHSIARDLDLGSGRHKVLILPTHQSMVEHLVSFSVFQSPEFLEAMGWGKPIPFVTLARSGLFRAMSFKIGSKEMSLFGGVHPDTCDRMFEAVDGYVTRESLDGQVHSIPRMLDAMETRPGIIYPTGTTASFDVQLFPLQHVLFAKLPQDIVIVPVAFRGSHSIWPKCPKGNLDINPGVIEAVVSPPMLGETTLLPKRGSLRIQAEAAAFFQAVQIATLLNPEPRG
ncbi:MAG: hypothetical protein O7G87_22510 [bacterium]|nr:hypothetical protein [bacterium]